MYVGGGQGLLLKEILLAYPAARGIMIDQPQVIASAHQVPISAELAQRYRLVAGSFFESVPENGDAYLMKAILHDWDDNRSKEILRACRTGNANQSDPSRDRAGSWSAK